MDVHCRSIPSSTDYRERRFPNLEPYTPERLLEWARSTSSIAILEPADREQRLAELAEHVPHPPRPARPRHVPAADGDHDHPRPS